MKKICSLLLLLCIAQSCSADSYGIFDPGNALVSKPIKDLPITRPDISESERIGYENEVESLTEQCRKKIAHERWWFNRYPYYDVLFKTRGSEYAKDCDESLDRYFAPQIQNITTPANQLVAEGTRIKKSGDDMIANGQSKKTESTNLFAQVAETEREARELIKDGNAIKGKGEKMYAAGDVDEAKQFLNEGNRRINVGNAKLNEATKLTERGQVLVAEGTKLVQEGETLARQGQAKIDEGNQRLLALKPLESKVVLLKQASRLFRPQD